jgi:hypothetical protein
MQTPPVIQAMSQRKQIYDHQPAPAILYPQEIQQQQLPSPKPLLTQGTLGGITDQAA